MNDFDHPRAELSPARSSAEARNRLSQTNSQLRLFLEDVQNDILIAMSDQSDEERERFFSELADWAFHKALIALSKVEGR